MQGAVKCTGYNAEYELGDKTNTQRTTAVGVAGIKAPIFTGDDTQIGAITLSTNRFRQNMAPFTYNAPTSNRVGEIVYSSTNTAVATVDPTTQTVSIVGAGTAYLKASIPANATQSAAVSYSRISVPDTEFVQLGTSYYSSCGLTRAGGVKCWGNGDWGQLGNGTTDRRLVPTDVLGMSSGIAQISNGYHHTCAVTTVGGVKCWGLNDNGQLGTGNTTRFYTPAAVTGLSSGVVQVETGYQHTCALLATGAVKCWGYNSYGQLGDGSTTNSTVPVDVVGLNSGVVQIDLGNEFSCALLETGAVKCWGYNSNGQLGDGSATHRYVPRPVSGLSSGVSRITAGIHHACAVLSGGAVKCWGYGGYGQVGDGGTSDRFAPVAVSGLSSGVAKIVAGAYHTCALMTSGNVKCWGRNDEGELGDGTNTRRYVPTDVPSLASGVIDLAANLGLSLIHI